MCPSLPLCCCAKHRDYKQPGDKRFILSLPGNSPSSREARPGSKAGSRQLRIAVKQRPWRKLLTGFSSLDPLAFLTQFKLSFPEATLFTEAWTRLNQRTIKKMPTGMPKGQSVGSNYSTEIPSSQVCVCVKLTKTTILETGRTSL